MERRKFLAGISSFISAVFAWPQKSFGGFGIFQLSGGSSIPAGVALIEPDGTRTYYSTGYFNGTTTVPFSVATAFPISVPYTGRTVSYTNGWDDPQFFPIGGSLVDPTSAAGGFNGITMYHDLYWNTIWRTESSINFNTTATAGISVLQQNNELWSAQGGSNNGVLYNQPVQIPTGPIPATVISICIEDEPAYQNCWADPIGGTATEQNGVHSVNSLTITNGFTDGRPFWTNLSGFFNLIFTHVPTSPSNSTQNSLPPLTKVFATPNASTRNGQDLIGMDAYTMPLGRYADYWGANVYNGVDGAVTFPTRGTGVGLSMLQSCRGSNQGVMVDYIRNWCTNNLQFISDRVNGYTRPIIAALLPNCNGKGNLPYDMGMQESNWEAWSVIIHGARGILWFDHGDESDCFGRSRSSGFMQNAGTPHQGIMVLPDYNLNQSVTFTGQISGGTLTVTNITPATLTTASGNPGVALLTAGMEITSINGVSQSPNCPVIQTQLTFQTEGTFTGLPSSGTLTVSGLTGTVPVPSILIYPGTNGLGPANTNSAITSQSAGTVNGNGTYQYVGGSAASVAGCTVYCPGMNGTYKVSGGTAVTPVTMIAKQPDNIVLGSMTGTNHGTGTFYGGMQATCARILDLAPVINSRFAVDYILSSSTNIRYIFPYIFSSTPGTHNPVPHNYDTGTSFPSAVPFFTSTGIDCCVHYYEGPTYLSAISSESIPHNTFFIFATTAYPEDTAMNSIVATFVTADAAITSITVIGEGRTITMDSPGVFHDTFQFAWTVHVYRVNH